MERRPFQKHCETLALVSAADENYLPGLEMTFSTAVWSLAPGVACTLIVLDPGLPLRKLLNVTEAVDRVAKKKGTEIEWIILPVDLQSFQEFPGLRESGHLTYARLLLPTLLDLNSVIWIDSDFLVYRDLSEVQTFLKGSPLLAGCQDTGVSLLKNDTPVPDLAESELPYLNAGFLWMNLQKMREETFAEHFAEFMATYGKELRFHDQTALNSLVESDREVLPEFLNFHCAPWYRDNSALLSDLGSKNLHLLSGGKPWMRERRISCYTRNYTFYRTRELLTDYAVENLMKENRQMVSSRAFLKNLLSLLLHKFKKSSEGSEDRIQTFDELFNAHSRRYESRINKHLMGWFHRNKPARQKTSLSKTTTATHDLRM